MTLYKRGRVWWVEFQVDGVRYRKSTHSKNYNVAQSWVAQIDTARKMPTFEEAVEVLRMYYRKPTEGGLPIDSIFDTYFAMAKATGKASVAASTMTRRRNTVDRLLTWLHKERPSVKTVEAVTGPVAVGFATHLANMGLKSKTRINAISELTTIWRLLENVSTGIRNPWSALRPADVDATRGSAFTHEDERRVLAAAERVGKDWPAVCALMRHTGLRYGDVARLTWGEIQGDVIRLAPHKTKRHGISVAIPLTSTAKAALDGLTKRGEWVFPIHAEMYGKTSPAARRALCFREVLAAAGLEGKGYTIHSWRHTAATRLAAAGVEIETRKRILGHTVDATARRYDHDEHLGETRAALEAADVV